MSSLPLKIAGCLAVIAWGARLAEAPRRATAAPTAHRPGTPAYPYSITASAGGEPVPLRVAAVRGESPRRSDAVPRASYAGTTRHGIPRYTTRAFSDEERALLREQFGIEEPGRLYLSDTSETGYLRYDTRAKACDECMVNTYTVGAPSLRQPGETWEALERRIRDMRRREFPHSATVPTTTFEELEPEAREAFVRLLDDAQRAGFPVKVAETYRSPVRSAFVFWIGRGRTMTLTSAHSLGRAVDIAVTRGDARRARPSAQWVRFRRWVTQYDGGRFRIIGTPSDTWDWGHVELRAPRIGFASIEEMLDAARACDARDRERRQIEPDAPPVECSFSAPAPR